ncbi:MAG TPA: DUF3040 domain-containing protein [Pseudonocardia sp.]
MLNAGERRSLRDIERSLRAEDADFVRVFESSAARDLPGSPHPTAGRGPRARHAPALGTEVLMWVAAAALAGAPLLALWFLGNRQYLPALAAGALSVAAPFVLRHTARRLAGLR